MAGRSRAILRWAVLASLLAHVAWIWALPRVQQPAAEPAQQTVELELLQLAAAATANEPVERALEPSPPSPERGVSRAARPRHAEPIVVDEAGPSAAQIEIPSALPAAP